MLVHSEEKWLLVMLFPTDCSPYSVLLSAGKVTDYIFSLSYLDDIGSVLFKHYFSLLIMYRLVYGWAYYRCIRSVTKL